jgi:hypothetical protein
MNDEQHHPPQAAAPASQAAPQINQTPFNPVTAATADRDASDADVANPATQAAQAAAQDEQTPLNGANAVVTASDAATADRDASDAATEGDDFFEVTVPQGIELFRKHRRAPLSARSIQDYCDKGLITARKFTSGENQGWNMNEASLVKFILARPEVTMMVKAPEVTVDTTPEPPASQADPDQSAATPTAPAVNAIDPLLQAENDHLKGQLAAQASLVAAKDEVIAKMDADVTFLRAEIEDKRRINQDLKDIMSQMLDVIESGMGRNNQIAAAHDDAPPAQSTYSATVTQPDMEPVNPAQFQSSARDDRNSHHNNA